MAVRIDTAVIYNDKTVIDVVHGKMDSLEMKLFYMGKLWRRFI
jgi:hypothetical protein